MMPLIEVTLAEGRSPEKLRALITAVTDAVCESVLTGGITDAVFAPPGSTVTCKFSTLGEVTIRGGE